MCYVLVLSWISLEIGPLFLLLHQVLNTLILCQLGFDCLNLLIEFVNPPLDNRLTLLARPLNKVVVSNSHQELIGVLHLTLCKKPYF